MLNGSSQTIDKFRLASLVREARERDGLEQVSVAKMIDAPQNWVSQVELQKVSSSEDSIERLGRLAKVLKFEIPYIEQAKPQMQASPPPPPLSLPAKVTPFAPTPQPAPVPSQKAWWDAELEALRICSEAMEKLRDKEACQRVLGYVRARYGLPRLPDSRP